MSCVVQGREDVFTLKKRIVRQDFLEGSACAKQFKHIRNPDTMSANARTTAALIGFDCDSIEAFKIHRIFSRYFDNTQSLVQRQAIGQSESCLTISARANTLECLTMDKIILGTIAEIAAGIREKKFSPVEVVEVHLERVAEVQPKLNAFVHLDVELARRQARVAEAAVMKGNALGPLHGVPLTIKSCIDVAGWPTPSGSLLRKDYVAQSDAPLVARLRAAGAVILGNTNTPEYLMAYETDNSLSGKTSNPWNLERSAGGSSGGEAAAIASGCSVGGVGSDGGGSIRVPAHFCGICGLKPTPGRIPSTGHYPEGGGAFGWIGVVGPMARTVADVRVLFEAMAGPDAGDAVSAPVPVRKIEDSQLSGLRIGILESDALSSATPETTAAVERAAKILSEQGFAVEKKSLVGLDRAIEVWWYFFGPVIADSIRKGAAGHEEELSPMLREYVELATAEKELTYDGFLNACAERDRLRADLVRQMEDVRILLSPVSAGPAFRHGEGNWRVGEKENYRDTMRHSQWLNLAGFPGLAVPMGKSGEGLPIGVQVIGRPYEEELILAVGEAIERGRGPWQAPHI
jgi:Asp-tRNA(Asn)/Glu-tRNA(Gln) amidotransferase A subunit family amidase